MSSISFSRRTLLASAAALGLGTTRVARTQAAALAWQRLDSDVAPPARWDHTLSGDSQTKQLILFGGRDAGGAAFGDTWRYDLVSHEWSAIEGDSPSPRFGQAVAVDEKAGRLVLFGGQSDAGFFNDTWAFDFAAGAWEMLDAGDGTAPSPRYGLPGIIDAAGRLIVSHGFTFEGRFNDTWAFEFEAATWTDISPEGDGTRPLNRCLHEMAWDEAAGRALLFGGCSSGFGPCPQGDLWSLDTDGRAWTQLAPEAAPSARSNPALATDPRASRHYLFGGLAESGYTADLWSGSLDGDDFGWTPIETEGEAPSPRASHDLVLTRGDLYLFGGTGDAGVTNDLWKLSFD
jgi:hypothetical protein